MNDFASQVLSGYRLMWLIVMFDLPVVLPEERKAATGFRLFLLDQGFERAQWSVYMRFCTGPENAAALIGHIRDALPAGGKVDVVGITDRQYEKIISFANGHLGPARRNPEQFVLF